MNGFPASADNFVPAFGDLNNFFQQSSLNTSPGGVAGGGEASLTSTLNTNTSTTPVSPLAFGVSTPSTSTTNNAPVTATTSTSTPSAPTSSTPVKSGANTSAKSTTDGLSVGSFQSPSATTPATSIPASSATSGGGFTFTPTTGKDGKKDEKGSPTTNANAGATVASTPITAPTTNANAGATVASAPIAASTTNAGTGLEKNNISTQNLPSASEAWIKIDPDQSPIKLSIGNNENIICGKVSAIWIKCSLGSGASDPISGSGSFNIFSS